LPKGEEVAMRVAVIGGGSVGSTLAGAWAAAGHSVVLGSRRPDDAEVRRQAESIGAVTAPVGDAVTGADVVVCTIPGAAMASFVDDNAAALAHKVVIDATNNLANGPAGPGLSGLAHLGEAVASAEGYRAFNSVGWENMAEPHIGTETADMCFAGPDTGSRPTVEQLIADVGFRPVYVGPGADAHHAVDALATLWFALAFGRQQGRRVALWVLGLP
jgi:predicted dinucleotide-binding enzyme